MNRITYAAMAVDGYNREIERRRKGLVLFEVVMRQCSLDDVTRCMKKVCVLGRCIAHAAVRRYAGRFSFDSWVIDDTLEEIDTRLST
jgi:hypothetical protein